MEIIKAIYKLIKLPVLRALACLQLMAIASDISGQSNIKNYSIRDGRMYIELSKQINNSVLDSFISQYNLFDLPLKEAIHDNSPGLFKKLGWKLEINNTNVFAISKSLSGVGNMSNPEEKIIFAEKHPTFSEKFAAEGAGLIYGYNRFKNKNFFAVNGQAITFYLKGNTDARHVVLAGSFSNWIDNALPMTKTDSGWIVQVKIGPGKYWYKFIIDGNWSIDHDNKLSENDGRGNVNSVFYKTNYVFGLSGYRDAGKIFLAGSFNDWRRDELLMIKTSSGWELPLYLANGTHTYKFIVDGKWIADPKNINGLPDGENDFNSVIRIGNAHLFKLNGFLHAKQVILTGSFNRWRRDELYMNRSAAGWELPYTLGPGNYEYRFIVDGSQITDPANPLITNTSGKNGNSFLVVEPNFTFRLKGFANAKTIILTGDFDNWSQSALPMKHKNNEWSFDIHMDPGKHLYKFIVDGKWIKDPYNKLWEQNEYGTGNSVIWTSN